MYVFNHRNGAVDALLVLTALPRAVGLVGRNLAEKPLLKWFFRGQILLHRSPKDAAQKEQNTRELSRAVRRLASGESLVVCPEGTSELGPTLLPFRKGAARVVEDLFRSSDFVKRVWVVPAVCHYEYGDMFGTRAEVHLGTAFAIERASIESGSVSTESLTNQLRSSVSALWPSFSSRDELDQEAFLASCAIDRHEELSHLDRLRNRDSHRLLPPAGVGHAIGAFFRLLVYAVFVFPGAIVNCIPSGLARLAAHFLADDSNVVALWQMLVGVPLVFLWWIGVVLTAVFASSSWLVTIVIVVGLVGTTGVARWAWPRALASCRHLRLALGENGAQRVDPVLLHEWLWFLFLGGLSVLIWTKSQKLEVWHVVYPVLLIVFCMTVWIGRMIPKAWVQRVRFLVPLLCLNVVFQSVRTLVPFLERPVRDAELVRIDSWYLPRDLSLVAAEHLNPVLSEVLSGFYLCFFVAIAISFVVVTFFRSVEVMRRFARGFFTLYVISFVGYFVVPAEGPQVFFKSLYSEAISGFLVTSLNHRIVVNGSARFDVFPSLHIGATLFFALFFRKESRWISRLMSVFCVGIFFAVFYLRYHYFIDVAVGATLAVLCVEIGKSQRFDLFGAKDVSQVKVCKE